MNHWVILFQRPEPSDYSGPNKWKISAAKFEKICLPEVSSVQFGDSVYRMGEKKIFSIENYKQETTDKFCVCEVHKLKGQ